RNGAYYRPFTYSDYRAALVSHGTSADDAMALAHLPNGANNPVNGNQKVNLKLPLARALGFTAVPPAGQPDGTISLKLLAMNLSAANTDPTNNPCLPWGLMMMMKSLGSASLSTARRKEARRLPAP